MGLKDSEYEMISNITNFSLANIYAIDWEFQSTHHKLRKEYTTYTQFLEYVQDLTGYAHEAAVAVWAVESMLNELDNDDDQGLNKYYMFWGLLREYYTEKCTTFGHFESIIHDHLEPILENTLGREEGIESYIDDDVWSLVLYLYSIKA